MTSLRRPGSMLMCHVRKTLCSTTVRFFLIGFYFILFFSQGTGAPRGTSLEISLNSSLVGLWGPREGRVPASIWLCTTVCFLRSRHVDRTTQMRWWGRGCFPLLEVLELYPVPQLVNINPCAPSSPSQMWLPQHCVVFSA